MVFEPLACCFVNLKTLKSRNKGILNTKEDLRASVIIKEDEFSKDLNCGELLIKERQRKDRITLKPRDKGIKQTKEDLTACHVIKEEKYTATSLL